MTYENSLICFLAFFKWPHSSVGSIYAFCAVPCGFDTPPMTNICVINKDVCSSSGCYKLLKEMYL